MAIRLFQEGDKSKAICAHCKALVATTFVRRDVPFSSGKGVVKNLLVAVCDICDAVVATPAQSTPAIQDARKKAVKPLEAQLPAIYLDVLDLAAHKVDPQSTAEFRKVLVTLYLHRYASGAYSPADLRHAHAGALMAYKERKGAARRRLSLKVTERTAQNLKQLSKTAELSQTEVIKSVIYKIQEDVLDAPKPASMQELRTLFAVSA